MTFTDLYRCIYIKFYCNNVMMDIAIQSTLQFKVFEL